MSKPNVLVITQDSAIQDEFRDMLADEFEQVSALNSIDGIALSRMLRPTVVFVEQHLPHLQAVGVCKSLLANEKVRSIPVIVIADTESVNGELKTLSNVKGVVQQPLQQADVRAKIQMAVEGKPGAAGQESRKAAGSTREGPIRVLSVDDSSVVRKLVTMILTAEGFKVTTASDGVDGINKAKELLPDVILLDFVMPKMNGFQVCRILQKDERLRQIPVILVTSKGDKVGDKFVDQLGVTGYITKPFQPEELVSKIHQTLEARDGQKAGIAGPATVIAEERPILATEADHGPAPRLEVTPAAPARILAEKPAPSAPLRAPGLQEGLPGSPQQLEAQVASIVKAEFAKLMKTLDKQIEKVVIEKMNEYIRRAKKKD